MPNKLFSFTSVAEAHAKLEEILGQSRNDKGHVVTDKAAAHQNAECRIDQNDPQPYQVWDGPAVPNTREPDPPPPPTTTSDLDKIADLVVKKLIEKGLKP